MQSYVEPGSSDILNAHRRIQNYINHTALISNKNLNNEFGSEIFFKMENRQKTNSFKARGAFNAILAYKEKYGRLPEKIVVQSSGNHAQATANACKNFGIPCLVYMISAASPFKIATTRALGAEVILKDQRSEVNQLALDKQKEGYFFIHPSSNDDVICGQATCALEAINEVGKFDAIFAPCGGGGLVSGTFLTAKLFSPESKVFACEPLNANDAAKSFRNGKIFSFEETPDTIADGARTLSVSDLCFNYLRQLPDILEISESDIIFWQKKLIENLQEKIEPTSALAIAGCALFLKQNPKKNQKLLVIISGGNIPEQNRSGFK